jgi:NADH dehydrogenase/NADH:ubiquinone oxidoreductase subunit G
VTSCLYPVWDGVEILTNSPRAIAVRKLVLELLISRCPDVPVLQKLAQEYKISETRYKKEDNDCILCGLCVKACEEVVGVRAISMINRGSIKEVNTPYLSASDSCIACGSCVYVCPTNCIKMTDAEGCREIWHTKFKLQYCKKCGNLIGPEKQLEHARKTANLPEDFYEMCNSCK